MIILIVLGIIIFIGWLVFPGVPWGEIIDGILSIVVAVAIIAGIVLWIRHRRQKKRDRRSRRNDSSYSSRRRSTPKPGDNICPECGVREKAYMDTTCYVCRSDYRD